VAGVSAVPELSILDDAAIRLTRAIQTGDLSALRAVLEAEPAVARARVIDLRGGARTPLHLVTDWPGYFPNGPAIARMLLDAGADPNGDPGRAQPEETPLHWAASSDDAEVAVVLLDAGADPNRPGSVIGGGGPLNNAVGFGCWHVARLLVDRGATVTHLWQAPGLGMLDLVAEFAAAPDLTAEDLNHAFWQACHGGARRTAEFLLALGADVNATPDHNDSTPLRIALSPDTRRQQLGEWLRSVEARDSADADPQP